MVSCHRWTGDVVVKKFVVGRWQLVTAVALLQVSTRCFEAVLVVRWGRVVIATGAAYVDLLKTLNVVMC
jgi:hypothetical protein